ncbi:MAG: (2Fe-2S)-binding protein [Jatrophihabitans sp.]|uniref:(2Fe-2S)-binding protein n=1 Tax=Jatrophihabitans sp. TaxID=1932789 RepID=UPI003F809FAF
MQVTMTVNGEEYTREIEGRLLLVHFLRDHLGLTGTHWGCDTSNCGTCVVWLDGEPVKSCTVLAAMAGGHEVRTVEGLERNGELDPIQRGFTECHGLQCGFCTPGMLMTTRALLDRNPHPTEAEIREAISGQICRCTGYVDKSTVNPLRRCRMVNRTARSSAFERFGGAVAEVVAAPSSRSADRGRRHDAGDDATGAKSRAS